MLTPGSGKLSELTPCVIVSQREDLLQTEDRTEWNSTPMNDTNYDDLDGEREEIDFHTLDDFLQDMVSSFCPPHQYREHHPR